MGYCGIPGCNEPHCNRSTPLGYRHWEDGSVEEYLRNGSKRDRRYQEDKKYEKLMAKIDNLEKAVKELEGKG